MAEVTQDLNTVIASAVQARIETEVLAALSGSDVFAQFVNVALNRKIEVKDPNSSYRTRETTYIAETISKAIQAATKAAVEKVIAEEAPQIEAEVTKELRRNVKGLAAQMVGCVVDKAASPYGITVELKYPANDR
jgi:hypothetical protein